jgi:hypothetical protein
VVAIRRAGPARPAVRRGAWRVRRRPGRRPCWSWRRSAGCWRWNPIWRPWCWPAPRSGSPAARRRRGDPAADRRRQPALAVAHGERQARYDLTDVLTTGDARPHRAGCSTAQAVVLHGDSADKLIVSARVSGERDDPDGIALFLVDAKASGVARRGYPMRDGTRAADIAFPVRRRSSAPTCSASRRARDDRARRRSRHRRPAPRRSARWKRCWR